MGNKTIPSLYNVSVSFTFNVYLITGDLRAHIHSQDYIFRGKSHKKIKKRERNKKYLAHKRLLKKSQTVGQDAAMAIS